MSAQAQKRWTVRLTFEQQLLFEHIDASSEVEAVAIAEDMLKNPANYVVEDENTIEISAEMELD